MLEDVCAKFSAACCTGDLGCADDDRTAKPCCNLDDDDTAITSSNTPPADDDSSSNATGSRAHAAMSSMFSDLVRSKDYRTEGEGRLLHGLLHVKIIRAKNIRNTDGLRGLKICAPKFLTRDKSDPYVTVKGGDHRFVKTRVIDNDLNPVWNEDFYIQVAHHVARFQFDVKDSDFNITSESLGGTTLPVTDLVKYDDDGNPKRVGVHRVALLDGKASHGSLEYFIEYVPSEMVSAPPEVPGVYFKERTGNTVKLYVNADDVGVDGGAPVVKYGGPSDDDKVWQPARLWRDIYDAICGARHFIYITGWAVDTTQSLLRGKEREEALEIGRYSPYLGDLLKQKAEEGVAVNMLVWDDASSTFNFPGMMGTHDEDTKKFFAGSKVTLRLAPMLGGEQNALHEKAGKFVMFTHHQKLVILDSPRADGKGGREPLAFVGGVDLTDGRWDNRKHPLFRTLTTDHQGDTYNGCYAVNVAEVGPREPWHDIHSSVRGPAVIDVITNFRERWYKQAADAVGSLIDLHAVDLAIPPENKTSEEWHTQLFRSIDARTAVFDKGHLASFVEEGVDDIEDVEFQGDVFLKNEAHGSNKLTKFMRKANAKAHEKMDHLKDKMENHERTRFYEKQDAAAFRFTRDLELKKGRDIDASVHAAMIHHVRRAEHTIYVESQYFLGSSHMWPKCTSVKCGNLVASELTLKICQKIEAGERFAAYVLLPMWPEGIPESGSVQAILRWQKYTMESMYLRIAAALKRTGLDDEGITPKDYLNFYCLGNRETEEGSVSTKQPAPNTIEDTLSKSRRHQIYVHSKMLIIDDTVALIGSSNINQRSLDGARDSEILLGSWQPAHVATKESIPHGDVHGYRMHCWATTMGRMEDVFRDPASLDCVRRVNEIAEENWRVYAGDETVEMDSHLIPYPIEVGRDGTVEPRSDLPDGCFPDTKAKVTGTKSGTLPEILTT